MTNWIPELNDDDRPRYAAIVHVLARDIRTGRLEPGDRLPTHRALAEALGLALGTVTRAYSEAHRQGLVEGEVGRGTFVRDRGRRATRWALDATPDPSMIDLSLLVAPRLGDGELARRVRAGLADIVGRVDLDEALGYAPHAGSPAHRAAGGEWLARAGLGAETDEVLVTASAQHAIACTMSVVARPGDVVMTESLTAPGLKDVASWMQLRLHGLPSDEDGLLPAAFDAACRTGISRVLYTMPVLHNPTTVSMSEERRVEIATVAERYQVAIVEDGVHALLADDERPPLTALAPDLSYYVTSLSKTIAPGLRIGFLRAPRTAVPRLESAIRATMWMASPLLAETAATWIGDGTADLVLEARRAEARARQEIARERLEGLEYDAHPTGYQVWLAPPAPWRASELVEAARREGVLITSADVFVAGRGHVPARVRLCLSSVRDRAALGGGLDTLRGLLRAAPEAASVA